MNAQIPRIAAVWRAVEELLEGDEAATGRIELEREESRQGAQRMLSLYTRKEIADWVSGQPMLLLDATFPETLVRNYLPYVNLLANVRVKAPHMEVRYVAGGFGKASLSWTTGHRRETNATRKRRVAELRDFIARETAARRRWSSPIRRWRPNSPGCRGSRRRISTRSPGLDRWKHVRYLFIIGRPLPPPEALRKIAAALTGRPIPAPSRCGRPVGCRCATGAQSRSRSPLTPTSDMEAVRAAITDMNVMQGAGRPRGVNRTAENPVTIVIMADWSCPWWSIAWIAGRTSRRTRCSAWRRGGAILLNPSDAARMYPELFRRRRRRRRRSHAPCKVRRFGDGKAPRQTPMRVLSIGECRRASGSHRSLPKSRQRPAHQAGDHRHRASGRDYGEAGAPRRAAVVGAAPGQRIAAAARRSSAGAGAATYDGGLGLEGRSRQGPRRGRRAVTALRAAAAEHLGVRSLPRDRLRAGQRMAYPAMLRRPLMRRGRLASCAGAKAPTSIATTIPAGFALLMAR